VKVEVYLDNTLIYKNSVLQRFVSKAPQPLTIDSSLFQKYSQDTGEVAREYKVVLTYSSAFSASKPAILLGPIPIAKPNVSVDTTNCPTDNDLCILVVNYANYQMPDSILFDYPGEGTVSRLPVGGSYEFVSNKEIRSVTVKIIQSQSVVDKFVVRLK
jgi:hypothetical protein